MGIRPFWPPACLALLAGSADAQFINRALWLGDDREGFRRDYRQDEEYFMDRAAYVDPLPWRSAGQREVFGNRLSAVAGSVSSDELTVEALADVGVELGQGFTGRFHYLQSEHQSARFERFAVGLDASISESLALFAQLEGTADKSRADLALGLALAQSELSAHRLSLTLVDFPQGKSDEFEYDRQPYGLGLAGRFASESDHELSYELGFQTPFEQRDLATDDVLEMHRAIGLVEARAALSERDRLIVGLEGELTDKSLEPGDGATAAESADVVLGRLRAEWWRSGASGRQYSLGASYLHLNEEYGQGGDPDETGSTERRELMLATRAHFPLGGAWSLEPYVLGGRVDLETQGVQAALDGDDFLGFQGKCGAPLRFDFSEFAFLRIDLSLQLDEFAFGGGAVQFVASF
jgi:hypothetical protein